MAFIGKGGWHRVLTLKLNFLGLPMQSFGTHVPVLLHEAVDALAVRADGKYLDATYGRGGHSAEILNRLGEQGRLYALDRDPVAIAQAQEKLGREPRFQVIQTDFASAGSVIQEQGLAGSLDGVLLDLGVSSPQLDDASRGFSFNKDGPLDMRMNTGSGQTAEQWLASAGLNEMIRVFRDYGEERYSPRIARAIIAHLENEAIASTLQLAEIVKVAHPRWERGKHPATRVFQAIRIHINGELDALKSILESSAGMLKTGGKLVVISFHSLEDRVVKRFMRAGFATNDLPRHIPILPENQHPFKVTGKPVYPSDVEINDNKRSRSSVLRVAERCA